MTRPAAAAADGIELPRPPWPLRRWMDDHRVAVNVLVLVFGSGVPLTGLTFLMAAAPQDTAALIASLWWALPITLASLALLFARRRWPVLVLLVMCAVQLLPSSLISTAISAPYVVALYSLGNYAVGPRRWIAFAASALISALGHALSAFNILPAAADLNIPTPTESDPMTMLITVPVTTGLSLVPVLIGMSTGSRRRYVHTLVERAHDLARERDQRAALAAADERARIAREMHDIVSHSLTVMVTLSEGAAAQSAPGTAQDAMRTVAETGRTSLTEMRRLLGVLRTEGAVADRAPQPDEGDLDALITRFRDAGMAVRLRREGGPIADRSVSLSAYRIMQEALINALRHAPGAREVLCLVRVGEGEVVVEVRNSAAQRSDPVPAGPGTGLIGARERAAIHGGSLTAAPLTDGGWLVRAVLPLEAPA